MQKKRIEANLMALYVAVNRKLSNQYVVYDPKYNLEPFKAFKNLLVKLKEYYPDFVSPVYRIPKPSGTEYQGRGHIPRAELVQLSVHIERCLTYLSSEAAVDISKSRSDQKQSTNGQGVNKAKFIFMSHAEDDKPIVKPFIDDLLVGCLNFKMRDILCTSIPGAKIKSGEDWRKYIYHNLMGAKVIFLVITPNYRASEICMNEMGAAWATNARVIPMIISPIDYSKVGVLPIVKQIERIDDEQSLDRIKDILQQDFQIPAEDIQSDRWSDKKEDFLSKIKKYLNETSFPPPPTKEFVEEQCDRYNKVIKENQKLLEQVSKQGNIITELRKLKDRTEVGRVEAKHTSRSAFDEFELRVATVRNAFKDIRPCVTTVIYNDYASMELHINYESCHEEIEEAIARKYINRDLKVLWNNSKKMDEIYNALESLRHFERSIGAGEIDDFFSNYERQYEAPLDITNVCFWEEVLELDIIS